VTSSLRLLALIPTIIAIGSVVVDFVLLEFFGGFFLGVVSLLVFVGVGLVLTLKLPRHAVGWLLLWAGALFQCSFAAGAYAWAALVRAPGTVPLGEAAALIAYAWLPALGTLFLAIMLFPTGRPPSPRWRLPAAVVVVASALQLVASWLAPRDFAVPQSLFPVEGALPLMVANPVAVDGPLGTLLGYVYQSPLTLVVYLIPVAAIVARFRTAAGNERQQLKWFTYSASIVLLFFVASGVVPLFSYLGGLGPVVAVVTMDLVPISVAIAILRYRLYDIDLLINRSIVYAATTGAIGITFFAGIVVLQAVLRPLTSGSELAVAASTLISVGLFQPLRRRFQSAVDRRFYRSRYNAALTLDAFSVRLRDEVDLDNLRADLLDTVQRTVQPMQSSIWLRLE